MLGWIGTDGWILSFYTQILTPLFIKPGQERFKLANEEIPYLPELPLLHLIVLR